MKFDPVKSVKKNAKYVNPTHAAAEIKRDPRVLYNPAVTTKNLANKIAPGMLDSAVNGPKAKQYSVPGKPADPTFGSAVQNGQLSDLYKVNAQTASMGQAGQELRNRALATGPSAWAQLQTQQQGLEQQNAMNAAAQQTAGANAQAQAGLAMRGGLGSGSRERLAASSAWNQLAAGQGVRNQGMQNRLGINIADQEQKNAMLGTSAGMETDLSKFNTGQVNTAAGMNAQTAFNNLQGQNQFNQTTYGQKMADRGATMNANAMLEANKPRSTFWKVNDPFQLSGK